jgi:hypothetical protein
LREVGLWPEAAVRRDAAIFPVLDDKPTLRGDRECVEFDPEPEIDGPSTMC